MDVEGGQLVLGGCLTGFCSPCLTPQLLGAVKGPTDHGSSSLQYGMEVVIEDGTRAVVASLSHQLLQDFFGEREVPWMIGGRKGGGCRPSKRRIAFSPAAGTE